MTIIGCKLNSYQSVELIEIVVKGVEIDRTCFLQSTSDDRKDLGTD